MQGTNEQIAVRVTWRTFMGNVVLSFFKLFAGIHSHSAAMVSDAAHSFSDVAGEVIVLVGIKMANQKSDKEHPYGHERMECVAAIILSFVLFSVGAAIGWSGARKIVYGSNVEAPGFMALAAAVISIVVKEGMYHYTHLAAKTIDSVVLEASAWHHRSDAVSSVGSFAGILGARLGYPLLDPVASVAICLLIIKASADVFMDAVGRMTDKACGDDFTEQMRAVILSQEAVSGIDQIKTRLFGSRIYVDVEILVDGEATLNEAHAVAQRVHDAIEREFPKVKHCMVHVNPARARKAGNSAAQASGAA